MPGALRDRAAGSMVRITALAALAVVGCESSGASGPEPLGQVLQRVAGDAQSGIVGEQLAQPVVVEARDADGRAVSGVEIHFAIVSGGGSVTPDVEVTGEDGRAQASWALGTRAGQTQRLRARIANVPASDIEFEATALPASPALLEKVSGDEQKGQRQTELRGSLVVRVHDAHGNPVPDVRVTFDVVAGDGDLSGGETITDDSGRASTRWTLGVTLGDQRVEARIEGLPTVSFSATALELPYLGEVVEGVVAGEAVILEIQLGTPQLDEEAPSLSVEGTETIIPGGGGLFRLAAQDTPRVLYVFMAGREGFFEVTPGTSPGGAGQGGVVDLALIFGDVEPDASYQLRFAAGTGAGAGPHTAHVVQAHPTLTGAIQVSVVWDVPSDVDLYLVEPSGETIYFDHPVSSSGGTLDLDANGACIGDDLRNENITWPDTPPPRGTYVVRANLWSACQQEATGWLVVLRVEGEPVRTFRGRFTGDGTGGDASSGEHVTTFVY